MCTFNALSVTSFGKMFNTVFELNKKYSNSHRVKPILIDIAYLRNPEYQSVKVLTKDFNEIFKKTIQQVELKDFVIEGRKNSYYHLEIIKLKRLYDWMQEPISVDEKNKLQRAFYSFFSQMDERRGLDFCKTFPEMESFWKICKKEYTGYKAFKKFQDFFKMEKIKDFSIENISERYKHYRYRLQLAVRSIPLVGPLLLKLYYFTFYVLNKYTNKFKYKK